MATVAQAGDGELDPFGHEVMLLAPQMISDLLHQRAAMVIDQTAVAAHQMEVFVGVADLPVPASFCAEMGVSDFPNLLKQGKRSIDRRQIDRRIDLGDSFRHRISGEVFGCVGQHLPDEYSGPGDPLPMPPQYVLSARVSHASMVRHTLSFVGAGG